MVIGRLLLNNPFIFDLAQDQVETVITGTSEMHPE